MRRFKRGRAHLECEPSIPARTGMLPGSALALCRENRCGGSTISFASSFIVFVSSEAGNLYWQMEPYARPEPSYKPEPSGTLPGPTSTTLASWCARDDPSWASKAVGFPVNWAIWLSTHNWDRFQGEVSPWTYQVKVSLWFNWSIGCTSYCHILHVELTWQRQLL